MAVGILLGGDQPWGQSVEQEVDRRMLQPNKIDVGEAAYESFHEAFKRGETPGESDAGMAQPALDV